MLSSDSDTNFKDSSGNFRCFCQTLSPLIYDYESPKKKLVVQHHLSLSKDLCSSRNPFDYSAYFSKKTASLRPDNFKYINIREINEFNPNFEENTPKFIHLSSKTDLESQISSQKTPFQKQIQTVKKEIKNINFLTYNDIYESNLLDETHFKDSKKSGVFSSYLNLQNKTSKKREKTSISANCKEFASFPSQDLQIDFQENDQINKSFDVFQKNPDETIGSSLAVIHCNCSRTQCLKLYCECFARGQLCNSRCRCEKCCNNEHNHDLRTHIMKTIVTKNPLAFYPKNEFLQKINMINEIKTEKMKEKSLDIMSRGCKCKKSFCKKKYCECFINNFKCTNFCKCQGCKNKETHKTIKNNLKSHQNKINSYHFNIDKMQQQELLKINVSKAGLLLEKRKANWKMIQMSKEEILDLKNEYMKNKRVHRIRVLEDDFWGNSLKLNEINNYFRLCD